MPAVTAELAPHPTTPCPAIRRISVAIALAEAPRALAIHYRVEGDLGRLRLPLPGTARRRDGLWQHSCFEAFMQSDASDSYHEFNFTPSGDWAAYRFGSRRGARTMPDMPAPHMAFQRYADACDLRADLPLATLPELDRAGTLCAALTAVIEATDGRLSYWALAHRAEKPDFHDPSTFTLQVTTR